MTENACHCEEARRADAAGVQPSPTKFRAEIWGAGYGNPHPPSPKAPLCKGSWHGAAVTEGLSGVAGPFGDDFCSDSHPFLAPAAASAPLCAGYPGQLMKPPAPTRRARRPGVPNPRPPPILNDRSSIPPLQKRESPAPALSCRGGAPFLLGSALRANLLYWISMLVFLGRTFWAALGTDTCRMPFSKLAWMSSGITLSPT